MKEGEVPPASSQGTPEWKAMDEAWRTFVAGMQACKTCSTFPRCPGCKALREVYDTKRDEWVAAEKRKRRT